MKENFDTYITYVVRNVILSNQPEFRKLASQGGWRSWTDLFYKKILDVYLVGKINDFVFIKLKGITDGGFLARAKLTLWHLSMSTNKQESLKGFLPRPVHEMMLMDCRKWQEQEVQFQSKEFYERLRHPGYIMRKFCKSCGDEMELVDEDPDLGSMFYCERCDLTYNRTGNNAFDTTGWSR